MGLKNKNNDCFYLVQGRKNYKGMSLFGIDDIMFTSDKEKTHLFFNFAILSRLMINTMQNMGTRKWKPKVGEGMGKKKTQKNPLVLNKFISWFSQIAGKWTRMPVSHL